MTQETIIYFAYGANLDLRGMQLRCPGCQPLGTGILPDHRLVFRGVADIEPAAGEQVHGALYAITPEHLYSLDRFESYPRLYNRKQVQVIMNDKTITATVYQMTKRNGYSPPSNGYLGIILSGCRQWGIPEANIRTIIKSAANSHFGGW